MNEVKDPGGCEQTDPTDAEPREEPRLPRSARSLHPALRSEHPASHSLRSPSYTHTGSNWPVDICFSRFIVFQLSLCGFDGYGLCSASRVSSSAASAPPPPSSDEQTHKESGARADITTSLGSDRPPVPPAALHLSPFMLRAGGGECSPQTTRERLLLGGATLSYWSMRFKNVNGALEYL